MRDESRRAGPGASTPGTSATAHTLYRERLWPGPWVWVSVAAAASALGIAYGAAFGAVFGWAVCALVAAVTGLLIWRGAPTVLVREDALVVDRAALPWWATGGVLVLEGDGVQRARGGQGDSTAYSVMRPGVGPGAVVIEVTDANDPHATWLVGSRNAEAMARAIHEARGSLTP